MSVFVVGILVGLGLVALWLVRARYRRGLQRHGRETRGRVAHATYGSIKGWGGTSGTTHVRYTDDAGEYHRILLYGRFADRGTEVTVWYDPEHPERAVTSLDPLQMQYVLFAAFLTLAVSGIGLALAIMDAAGGSP